MYGVATVSRIDKISRLFCRISSLLQGLFAKKTCYFIDPTHQSQPIPEDVVLFAEMTGLVACANELCTRDCAQVSRQTTNDLVTTQMTNDLCTRQLTCHLWWDQCTTKSLRTRHTSKALSFVVRRVHKMRLVQVIGASHTSHWCKQAFVLVTQAHKSLVQTNKQGTCASNNKV